MTLSLPDALTTPDDAPALALLKSYYGRPLGSDGSYAGGSWDTFDPTGGRSTSGDRFTAEDLVSLFFLSERIGAVAAEALLDSQAERFSEMLAAVGPDRDLADETGEIDGSWPGSVLYAALRDLPDIGPTRASKLMARKRPMLFPIRDAVVQQVLQLGEAFWEPLRLALRADDQAVHVRLLRLQGAADLPDAVSALRVFDVITWMEGKQRGF